MEIHSPKLQGGASESGAAVFKVDYFGTEACLAQSPQVSCRLSSCPLFGMRPDARSARCDTQCHVPSTEDCRTSPRRCNKFSVSCFQLYKQMAVLGGLDRVYEVGPVFRAENSHTNRRANPPASLHVSSATPSVAMTRELGRRHLCEFTGLDFEMSILEHYDEVMDVLELMLVSVFDVLKEKHLKQLQIVSAQYPFSPLRYRSDAWLTKL